MSNIKRVPNTPEVMLEVGDGSPLVVFSVGTHGNEYQPVKAAREFVEKFKAAELIRGALRVIVSNPAAQIEQKRFLDEDLNRAFPGKAHSQNREARLAAKVLRLVADADYVIDLHTAPNPPPFVILGSRDEARLGLAELAPVNNIVLFEASEPCAMVDYTKCGIGIEIGSHDGEQSHQTGLSIMRQYIRGLGLVASGSELDQSHDYYEIFAALTRQEIPDGVVSDLEDFKPVSSAEFAIETDNETVFPVLCGDKDYSQTYCYLARSVSRESLGGQNE